MFRTGSRAALVEALGVLPQSGDLAANLPSFLPTPLTAALQAALTSLSHLTTAPLPSKLLTLAPLWLTAKVFLIDSLGVPLALASGVLFNSVPLGALVSVTLATLSSVPPFLASRYVPAIRTRAQNLTETFPSLDTLSTLIGAKPLRTIALLRLSPVLPIPIGGYNYAYGALTNVTLPQFATGISLGSIKPYLLDSYLGVAAYDTVTGNGGVSDSVLFVAVAGAAVVGALAAGVVQDMYGAVAAADAKREGADERKYRGWPGGDVLRLAECRVLSVLEWEAGGEREGENLPDNAPERGEFDGGLAVTESLIFLWVVGREVARIAKARVLE